jgi:hypothetical protein
MTASTKPQTLITHHLKTYGMGTNPTGGAFTLIIHPTGTREKIYHRLTRHVDKGRMPVDGGFNYAGLYRLMDVTGKTGLKDFTNVPEGVLE